jgi:pimeloyl-ACP methyl ester carboxylesterase
VTTVIDGPARVAVSGRRSRRRTWFRRSLGVVAVVLLELAVTGLVYQAETTEHDRQALPAAGRLVDIGGHRLHVQCSGQGGPTVLLETGLGAWSSHWALVQPTVAEHTRVCSYDRAGLGWSDSGPLPRDARQIATELRVLLQNAEIPGPYVLAGHSTGGLYARLFASLYPTDVVGLVLMDPTPVDLFESQPATRGRLAAVEWQARTFQWLAPFGIVRLLIPGALGAELTAYPTRARDEIVAINSVGRQWEAVAAEVESLPDSMAQVGRRAGFGSLPLVVLSSTRGGTESVDEVPTKLRLDTETAALSSNGRHVLVNGATHTSLVSNPDDARVTIKAILEAAGR